MVEYLDHLLSGDRFFDIAVDGTERGLLAAVSLVENGLCLGDALELGIVNKSFDDFERQLVNDIISARIDGTAGRGELFLS